MGLAIDLGSTTVAVYLTMLDNGEVVAGGAALNQQRIYAADIISRLHAALHSADHRQRWHRLVISSINQASWLSTWAPTAKYCSRMVKKSSQLLPVQILDVITGSFSGSLHRDVLVDENACI